MRTMTSLGLRACPQLVFIQELIFQGKQRGSVLTFYFDTFCRAALWHTIFVPAGRPRAAPLPRSAYADGYLHSERPKSRKIGVHTFT